MTIRFQENANRKVVDYKINEFQKFLRLKNRGKGLLLVNTYNGVTKTSLF